MVPNKKIILSVSVLAIIFTTTFVFGKTQTFYKAFSQGKRYFAEARYAEAIPYLLRAFDMKPADPNVPRYLASSYEKMGNKKEVVRILNIAVKFNPNDPGIRELLADNYYSLQDYARAESLYRGVLKVKSGRDLKRKLAEVLIWQKKYGDGIPLLEGVYNEDRNDHKAAGLLADACLWAGEYKKSIAIYKELHAKFPQDKNITLRLAQALGYNKEYDAASLLLEELKKAYQDDDAFKYAYATILESNQKFDEAKALYLELLNKRPDDSDLKFRVAEICAWTKNYTDAIRYYKELLAGRMKGDAALKKKLADALYWNREYKEAIKLYEEAGIAAAGDRVQFNNLAGAYMATKEFEKALRAYKELLKEYPDDYEAAIGVVDLLYETGNKSEAEERLRAILKARSGDIKVMKRLAEVLAGSQKYDEAIRIFEKVLSANPEDRTAQLWLARLLSWQGSYKNALKQYDSIIAGYPDDIEAGREKARVLGWMRKYSKSMEQYALTAGRAASPQAPVRLEAAAKGDYYKRFDIRGIRDYEKWIAAEPENLEALFDLGQLYSRQMRWEDAANSYNRILSMSPSHFQAKQAMGKVALYSKSPEAAAGFESYQAASTSRDMDEEYWDVYTSVILPIVKGLYLGFREDTFMHSFSTSTFESAVREKMGASLEYNMRPEFWFRAAYSYSTYSRDFKNSNNFNEEANVRLIDGFLVTVSHKKEDVLDNPQTLSANLKRDDYKIRVTAEPNRRISAGADYTYSHYTDTNNKFIYGFDVKGQLIYEPTSLSLTYRYEEYGYHYPSPIYFSPGKFHYNTVTAELRQFLNRGELFWGANDTYYTVKYAVNFDVHDQVGHLLYADFHRDWNNRLSTHIEWSKKIYEHRNTYGEERLTGSLKYYF